MTSLLEISDLQLSFGGAVVLEGVSLTVEKGECVGLIGPNGAGKSSVLNCISRSYRQQSGSISYDGKMIDGLRPDMVVKEGVARTFQNVELSPARTVVRNTLIGAQTRMRASYLEGLLGVGRCRSDEARAQTEARSLLERLGLRDLADQPVGGLPYGTRKLVEIARAVLGKPQLLLLDEPVAGTNPDERVAISGHIARLAEEFELSIILVEHDVAFVRSLADRIVVLDFGRVIASGLPDAVLRDEVVIKAYLGKVPV